MTSFFFSLIALFKILTLAVSTPIPTPPKPVAVVFGAGLASQQQPSVVLRDRLDTAYELYAKGVVTSIFLSGDSTKKEHDEVGVMKSYLVKKGIPESAFILDTQGIDTYTTCLHAKKDRSLDEVILVTQGFHMPRAEYLCEGVGLQVTQGIADKRTYDPKNEEREKKAMAKAWLQLNTDIAPDQMELLESIVE
ncbi:MAG: YdcF family protein [Patescibacteria group bacterium]